MEKSRLEMLQEYVQKKPDDAFSRYGLANELKSLGRNDEAVAEFRTLLQKNEKYAPGYVMLGQLLAKLGRTDEAKEVFTKGIAIAGSIGNAHAAGEMTEFLAGLE